jgi:hypothetical protein
VDGDERGAAAPRRRAGYRRHLTDFNDDPATTHADVLALYDDAIQLAERDPTA